MSASKTADFCGERAKAYKSRTEAECDPERRRRLLAEASSWRGEQLFWQAVKNAVDGRAR